MDSYDALGRPRVQRQVFKTNGTWGQGYTTQRTYNLADRVTSQTYPSGRVVNYSYDNAGRATGFTGNLGDGVVRTYASSITYSAWGSLQEEQFGTQTPLFHKLHYNIRGQLNDIRISTASWSSDEWNWNRGAIVNYYATADLTCPNQQCRFNGGPDNNGNLRQSQHWIPANDQITSYNWTEDRFVYDALNRLKSVAEFHGSPSGLSGQDFIQVYDYDRWGNRTINQTLTQGAGAPKPWFAVNEANNQLAVPGGQSGNLHYDAAGNLDNDSYSSFGTSNGVPTRSFEAENRMTEVRDANQQVVSSYAYNADGQRVRRKVSGVETLQIYGMEGELLAEYKSGAATFIPTKEYGYRNSQLEVTMASGDDVRLSRFVTNLYYGALQRDPTSQELQDKMNQLAAAGAQGQSQLLTTASQIARSLFVSTNYETSPPRSDSQYVTDLYYAYLQRGPDDGGLGWWTGQVPGSGRVNVLNAFEASSEFATLVSTLYGTAASDNERTEHFVNNFYLGAYGRNATSTELQQQRDALNNAAALGLSQVKAQAETFGRSLFTAQINDAGLSNTQFVTNLYEAFLQRGPDTGGLGFWSGQATLGQGRQNVVNAFAACDPFRELTGTLYRESYWLVGDHLGTPRMIVSKSGSLAGIKRHDYLPFGEEIAANAAGRTPAQGYSQDSVRQKFTEKERDNETQLDYFLARYYSNAQGRFTSVDPENAGAHDDAPQSWNGYSYVHNNPMTFFDRWGLERCAAVDNNGRCTNWVGDYDGERSKEISGGMYKNGAYWNAKDKSWETREEYRDRTYDPLREFINQMATRTAPIPKATAQFAAIAVVGGTTGGVAYYFLAPATVTTLGLGATGTSTVTEGSLASLSIQQLNGLIRGSQQQLLSRLFGNGMEGAQRALASGELPAGLTRQALLVYREIAKRAIENGIDKAGVQAVRLKIIEQALTKIK